MIRGSIIVDSANQLRIMSASSNMGLDATAIEAFTKNRGFGRLKLRTSVVVTLTLEGFYYAGRVVVERVMTPRSISRARSCLRCSR